MQLGCTTVGLLVPGALRVLMIPHVAKVGFSAQ